MFAGRPARAGVVLVLASLACLSLVPTAPRAADRPPPGPRLAVLVVFDQLRGDYLSRWAPLFEKGGFRRLTSEGAWFQDCHYPFAGTWTAAGHASVATGCSPEVHGVVANEWYDRKQGKEVSCVASARYALVPPEVGEKKAKGASPEHLLAPTFADVLREATHGQARVVALSLKDRSAVLPAGRRPTACYWMDKSGRFVTSTYYRDREHDWVRQFNASGLTGRWLGKPWRRCRDDVDYERWAGPDDFSGEGNGYRQGRTFPHPFQKGKKDEMKNYLDAVGASPMGNEVLLELARRAVEAEKLGSRSTPDFLSISFSSNDLVGHVWGPDSQEVLDTTLRSDRIVRDLVDLLDRQVGKDRWVMVLTADHGICPLPEVTRARGREARRLDLKKFEQALEEHLDRVYPPGKAEEKGKGQWTEKHVENMLYLDRQRIARRGAKQEEVEAVVARWAIGQRGIRAAYTRKDLAGRVAADDPLGARVQRSYCPERSGDVTLVLEPYCLMMKYLTGTTHGSPHAYDTHVPLVVFGPGVSPGVHKERVNPQQAAVILARAFGLKPPAKATVRVPAGLFNGTGR
jgi:predicted AlkP superfamily pyrophosphatase or phosphodiesterase